MEKKRLGVLTGFVLGMVDVALMVLQGLTWDANLSALSMWIVAGFLVSTTSLGIRGPLKGVLMAFLVLIPSAFIIAWNEPLSMLPIIVMTVILGFLLGFITERFG